MYVSTSQSALSVSWESPVSFWNNDNIQGYKFEYMRRLTELVINNTIMRVKGQVEQSCSWPPPWHIRIGKATVRINFITAEHKIHEPYCERFGKWAFKEASRLLHVLGALSFGSSTQCKEIPEDLERTLKRFWDWVASPHKLATIRVKEFCRQNRLLLSCLNDLNVFDPRVYIEFLNVGSVLTLEHDILYLRPIFTATWIDHANTIHTRHDLHGVAKAIFKCATTRQQLTLLKCIVESYPPNNYNDRRHLHQTCLKTLFNVIKDIVPQAHLARVCLLAAHKASLHPKFAKDWIEMWPDEADFTAEHHEGTPYFASRLQHLLQNLMCKQRDDLVLKVVEKKAIKDVLPLWSPAMICIRHGSTELLGELIRRGHIINASYSWNYGTKYIQERDPTWMAVNNTKWGPRMLAYLIIVLGLPLPQAPPPDTFIERYAGSHRPKYDMAKINSSILEGIGLPNKIENPFKRLATQTQINKLKVYLDLEPGPKLWKTTTKYTPFASRLKEIKTQIQTVAACLNRRSEILPHIPAELIGLTAEYLFAHPLILI